MSKTRGFPARPHEVQNMLAHEQGMFRRVVKLQPEGSANGPWCESSGVWRNTQSWPGERWPCPYGGPGDTLWVRETWQVSCKTRYRTRPCVRVRYKAHPSVVNILLFEDDLLPRISEQRGWRPSIHMPRWVSRLTLKVEDVRVERVQKISAVDAFSEGIPNANRHGAFRCYLRGEPRYLSTPEASFRTLWDSINASPKLCSGRWAHALLDTPHYVSYPWEDIQETREHRGLPWIVVGNPRVWAGTFRKVPT